MVPAGAAKAGEPNPPRTPPPQSLPPRSHACPNEQPGAAAAAAGGGCCAGAGGGGGGDGAFPEARGPDLQAEAAVSLQVDALGVGTYQLLVLAAAGFAMLAECIELGAVEPVNAALGAAFDLSLPQRAALPALHYFGAGIGVAFAGPLCDQFGRKIVLVWSNLAVVLTQAMLASLPTYTVHGSYAAMTLRCIVGLAVGLGCPSAVVLAMESAPRPWHGTLMYAIQCLSSFGFLVGALGLHFFMPHFGEASTDTWRTFCIFSCMPALVSWALIVLFVSETPAFCAVNGDSEGCAAALACIARTNGVPPTQAGLLPQPPEFSSRRGSARSVRDLRSPDESRLATAKRVMSSHATMLYLLSVLDFGRGFMVSGSSYLWPQLFEQTHERGMSVPPSMLNIFSECMGFIGLWIGYRASYIGTRRVLFLSATTASVALAALTVEDVRSRPLTLIIAVTVTKFCYGPLAACITWMKGESFPTEVRTTAFAFVSLLSKLGIALAPTLLEVMKGDRWTPGALSAAFPCLIAAAIASGALALLVPTAPDDKELLDAVGGKATTTCLEGKHQLTSKEKERQALMKDPFLTGQVKYFGSLDGSPGSETPGSQQQSVTSAIRKVML